MRIIAGKAKGTKLISPKESNHTIRPTLDRIKEPLFSILTPYLNGARVLDLFSGTGNLGLEALSRGAREAYLNDMSKDAIHLISTNVRLTHNENCAKISMKNYTKCLKDLSGEKFDLIFLDPPYELGYEKDILEKIAQYDVLDESGIVILESDKTKDIVEDDIQKLKLVDKRIYGRVCIRLYMWKEL